jgi:hypothetical protein
MVVRLTFSRSGSTREERRTTSGVEENKIKNRGLGGIPRCGVRSAHMRFTDEHKQLAKTVKDFVE